MRGRELDGICPVDLTDTNAEQFVTALLDLLLVAPHEPSGQVVIVRGHNHTPVGMTPQHPRRQGLSDRHRLAVLRRGVDYQDVIRVAGIGLYELLHGLGEE